MFCKHCGKELPEASGFCENCGTSVITGKRNRSAVNSGKTKLCLILGAVAVVAAVGLSMLVDYLKMSIDPTEYVTVEASGISGSGTVEVFFDKNDLLRDKIEGVNPEDNAWNESFLEEADPLRVFGNLFFEEESVSIVDNLFFAAVNQTEIINGTFENGDVVAVDIHVNQELLRTYGYHTAKDEYQVEFVIGKDIPLLREPFTFDYFQCLTLELSGEGDSSVLTVKPFNADIVLEDPINEITTIDLEITPMTDEEMIAYMRVILRDKYGMKLYSGTVGIAADRQTGLRQGDKVNITLVESDWIDAKGIRTAATQKEYTLD